MTSESELVQRCLGGDQAAWAELVARFDRAIRFGIRSSYRALGPEAEDEVAARVWCDLFTKPQMLSGFNAELAGLSTYLLAIGKSLTRAFFRTESRRRHRESVAAAPESVAPELRFDQGEFEATLTPAEKRYMSGDENLSNGNRWQLRHRVRRKLEAFLA